MLKRRIPAFSLIEIALVLSILGVISAYAIPVLLQTRAAARWRETDAKIESAMYALASYVQLEQRLPNPADPAATGDGAGDEQPGRTTGILPHRTLGLQASDVKDGFHHWISYSVSQSLTDDIKSMSAQKKPTVPVAGRRPIVVDTDEDSSPICHVRPGSVRLDVHNIQGQSLFEMSKQNDFIACVLVSHGPSGAGAFDDAGQRKPAIGDKLKNLGSTPFIDRSITKEYDDRVRWISRNNLMAMYAKQPCKPLS
jgi:type II secretory pathway pseudopilin PulG